jgi:hypothetical protein
LIRALPFAAILTVSLAVTTVTAHAQTGIFSVTGSMTAPRFQHTVTLLANGQVLATGGFSGPGFSAALASAELYNPTTGTFSATGSMSTGRLDHTATLLPNGQVLIAGGSQPPVSAEIYDPTTGTFSATGSMITLRGSHTATLLPNGQVLIAGGSGNGSPFPLASAELYDPATGTFSATGSMTNSHTGARATLLSNGKVLVTGGQSSSSGPGPAVASAELYDPATGTFSPTGSMSTARFSHVAALLPNGQVLVAGGSPNAPPSADPVASAELYDPATGTFSPTGSMSTARFSHAAALLPDGQVLVAGGSPGPQPFASPLASAELYDPATGAFRATGSMTTPRSFLVQAMATLLLNRQVLVAGGVGLYGQLASAELYISVPTDKDQCKNGGWMTLFRDDGSPFKNQGDCIQFVNTGK